MFVFYDFEVFAHDWLVVLIEMPSQKVTKIHNEPYKLTKYFERHSRDIWVGYNNTHYDVYILKAIMLGINPKEVNDAIIKKGKKGWQISNEFQTIKTVQYDCMLPNRGLKTCEAFQGKNIHETSVPFDIDRPLTMKELLMTYDYCENDVMETITVFMGNKSEFDAHMSLIHTFGMSLDMMCKTKAQLSALILGCNKRKFDDEWDVSIVPTLKLSKYDYVREWFLKILEGQDYTEKLTTEIAGVPHVFGFGGVHGARPKYHSKGMLIHVDVNSFYPSLMIEYDFLTRCCRNPQKYKEIYDYRLKLKREGKKKEQAPYKIVLNATFGIAKDKYSIAYDPRQANNICINGQLLLLDLIEKAESVQGCKLIQSNTDGLIYEVDSQETKEKLISVCKEWEERTRMGLGYDDITEIWQKDVNNYIFRFANGELERKGGYVKELNTFDYDLPIINMALVQYMTNKVSVEHTINTHKDLIYYQKIVKLSNKFDYVMHGENKHYNKSYRVIATTDNTGQIYKCKHSVEGGEIKHKFANTPNNCIIVNGDINNMTVDDMENFDKQYYINLAKKRISEFGIEV